MILIEHNETLVDIWSALVNLVGIGVLVAVAVSLIRRWRRATRPERRLYAPVYAAGVALMIALIGQLAVADGGLGREPPSTSCSSSRSSRSRWCRTCSSRRSCARA